MSGIKIIRYIFIVIITIICLFVSNMLLKSFNNDITTSKEVSNIEDSLTEEELDELDRQENNLIGELEIPKINLNAKISEGIDLETLASDIGHFTNSSVWNGNIALASHNRGSDVVHFFENINKLVKGDLIIYRSEMGERRYEVDSIREIENTDWSVTEDTIENIITLITCVTNRPEVRLCVQGTQIQE